MREPVVAGCVSTHRHSRGTLVRQNAPCADSPPLPETYNSVEVAADVTDRRETVLIAVVG
jgi:hypothetical protein